MGTHSDAEALNGMDNLIFARVLHVLGVVLWIGRTVRPVQMRRAAVAERHRGAAKSLELFGTRPRLTSHSQNREVEGEGVA
jgi:hypothetical protein